MEKVRVLPGTGHTPEEFPIELVLQVMDHEIRDRLRNGGAWHSEQEFVDAYAAQHVVKYGRTFRVNDQNAGGGAR